MSQQRENVSPDLIWECINGRNAYLLKTKIAGGHQFSRDPYNLTNMHSRKHEGFVNPKAISIQPARDTSKGVVLTTKKPGAATANRPVAATHTTAFGAHTPARKVCRAVARQTGGSGYRPDLRADAVQRASAVKAAQSEKRGREAPAKKLRGAKKRRAEAEQ